MSTPRVRIAPSPTGNLHIGTARAALFNYLFAKKNNGVFILRIEDTDLERSDPKYERNILESLEWLGIEWDEGALSNKRQSTSDKGNYGPYRQSERTETYKKYIEQLLTEGKAFYCYHSEEELEQERKDLMTAKKPPIHVCENRDRPPPSTLQPQAKSIIRFKTPPDQTIVFYDIIRGKIEFSSNLLGDFSIAKSQDTPLYNFAVVIDDEAMKITHVIRGEDHIPNTPKQLLLIEALGFKTPQYAHLPLILGPDRSKLSKRHATTSIQEYREMGYLPEALFNFIALLGWNPGDNRELLSKDELISLFSLEKVQKPGAVFDIQKLDWMNGEYIRKKSVPELTELCKPYLTDFFQIPNSKFQIPNIEKIITLEQPRLKKLSEIGERVDYFFRMPEYEKNLLQWKTMSDAEIKKSLDFSEKLIGSRILNQELKEDIEKIFFEEMGANNKGKILWPLRVALTGKKASPGPFEIMEILGKEESLKRIEYAKKKLA